MLYLFATIGAVTVAVLMWRAFGPRQLGVSPRRNVAPDDDPEFLRQLSLRPRRHDDGDGTPPA